MNVRKTAYVIFLLISLLTVSKVFALGPDTLWTRFYGGSSYDIGYSVCESHDFNYLVTGYTSSFGNAQDVYFLKLNTDGDSVWTRKWGGYAFDGAHHVIETADSGYLLIGYTESYGAGGKDLYLLKSDQTGNLQWYKTYGGSLQDCGYYIHDNNDGTFLLLGYRDGPSGWYKGDIWILKIDSAGDTIWTKSYGGTNEEWAMSMVPAENGNFIISGVSNSFGSGGKDSWILKIDSLGDTLWTKTFGGSAEDVGYDIVKTYDDNFIIGGYINGSGQWTPGDLWIFKISTNGDSLWSKIYAAEAEETAFEMYETQDSGLIIGGSRGCNNGDMWLLRTDMSGDTLWTKNYGGVNEDQTIDLAMTSDGGYILTGYTSSFGNGYHDVYVVKTAPDTSSTGVEEVPYGDIESVEFSITNDIFSDYFAVNYYLNISSEVKLSLFDITGRNLRTIINEFQQDGNHCINIEKEDLMSGCYIVQIIIDNKYKMSGITVVLK